MDTLHSDFFDCEVFSHDKESVSRDDATFFNEKEIESFYKTE